VRVLVVNAGSSSLKTAIIEEGRTIAQSTVDRWDASAPLDGVAELLSDAGGVDAVGHRVVHGGPDHDRPTVVDDEVLARLDEASELAPLHNPRAIAAIREVGRMLADLPAVVCFDTAFHRALPAAAATYALPQAWNERWRLRRYGFHGISHASAVRRAAALVGRPLQELRVVSCHLGAGASLAAVRGGRSVDTTMGFTPLEGLVMATRSGSVDPGLLLWLLTRAGVTPEELGDALEHHGGLAGLSGTSGDLRDVLKGRGRGDRGCALAYDVFIHRLGREAGAMVVAAGGLDLLVITGGIGEHNREVRARLAGSLGFLGADVDRDAETLDGDRVVSSPAAPVAVAVVQAAEEEEIARQVVETLEPRAGGEAGG
jgi:acetate kinase